MRPCKQICEKSIYSFPSNQMSSKQLQSLMIRNRTRVPQNNSRIDYIYKLILGLDYTINRGLLLSYKYKCYIRYFNILLQGNLSQELKIKLSQMLSDIVRQLTTEEYNSVFEIEPPPAPPPPVIINDSGYIIYVVSRITASREYFIFKNISKNYLLLPKTSYTFDLSHPSNLNTKLSFSMKQNTGITYRGVNYVSTPGTPGAKIILTLYSDFTSPKIFTFNDIPNRIEEKYGWAYSSGYILTNLDTSIIQRKYNYEYLNARQFSYLSVYESSGPKYSLNDVLTPAIFIELNPNIYQITYGTYYLEIPSGFSTTLLNKGYESFISFVGDEKKKTVDYVYGTSVITQDINTGPEKINEGLYNFYYGNVKMTVYKPLPFRLSLFNRSYGFMGGAGLLEFVDSSISNINNNSVVNLQSFNTVEKNIAIRFNGDKSTNISRKYGLSMGCYIIDIPANLPITFLNSSKEDLFTILTSEDTVKISPFVAPDGNQYVLYTGRITILVKGNFEKISVCTQTGYSGGYELMMYNAFYGSQVHADSIYITNQNIRGLCSQNTINIIENRFISFNNTYEISQYGMSKGVYTFFNIPKEYPITFLNKGKEDLVELEGLQSNATLQGTSPDGSIYTFYYGILRVIIHGDFAFMSMYTLFNGYLGGFKMFIYDPIYDNSISYPDPLSIPVVTDVSPKTLFTEVLGPKNTYIPLQRLLSDATISYNKLYTYTAIYNDVTVSDKLSINSTVQNTNTKFTMKNGIYIFRCMTHYITLINKGNEKTIRIRGVLSVSGTATDGYSYTFYKGDTIAVYVYGNFGMASLEVYGGPVGNYILCHEENVLE